jgi:two-component sensor histidine kinase
MLLKRSGHEVIVTDNGTDALSKLKEPDHPRMAILDWLMPGMYGSEVCRELRKYETQLPVYIIMLTIKGEKVDIVNGLDAGANDYISKPYDPGELHARIKAGERIIELQEQLSEKVRLANESEQKIRTLLEEKDQLLAETHARMKETVLTISNLLLLQAEYVSTGEVSRGLKQAASRMRSLEILYDRIYRSANTKSISPDSYIKQLVENIASAYPDSRKVQLDFSIANCELDFPLLSSLGMILNELTSNSMLHAFKGKETGYISVSLEKVNGDIRLVYSDDGNGLPKNMDGHLTTLGLPLVRGICSQLNGNLQIDTKKGTSYNLTFPVES